MIFSQWMHLPQLEWTHICKCGEPFCTINIWKQKENMSCEFCNCPFRYLQFGHLKYHPISSTIEGNIYKSPLIYSKKHVFWIFLALKKEHVACYSFNPSCLILRVFKHFTTSQENQEILSGTLTWRHEQKSHLSRNAVLAQKAPGASKKLRGVTSVGEVSWRRPTSAHREASIRKGIGWNICNMCGICVVYVWSTLSVLVMWRNPDVQHNFTSNMGWGQEILTRLQRVEPDFKLGSACVYI